MTASVESGSREVLVDLADVSKRFGAPAPALDGVTAQVWGAEITGLVGPDGAGKTTLIRLMTGLMIPEAGSVAVLGHDSRQQPAAIQNLIGYMPQRFGLYEDLSVRENFDLYANLRGLAVAERPAAFDELLTFTDLKRFTARLAGKLSGGMKQKLGLACALLKKPRLLLLDEPSVGVDPISRRELWKMVQDLKNDGVGVLWSTAYLDEAEATARVEGRVYKLSGLTDRRAKLVEALDLPGVIDGVIQGEAVRLVLGPGADPATLNRLGANVAATRPRFEDAFIDMLGGGPGGRSKLAEASRTIAGGGAGAVIEAQGLTKRFGDFTAASGITFSAPRGEIFGLLGPNGAGKSTTFKMLCGLLRPTAGTGRVAGFDLRRDGAKARNRLGYMAQKFSLYGDLSAMQNLAFFAGVYGLNGAEKRERVALMVDVFDLADYASMPASQLPLGLKQRLALACAVMHEPEALFLDEPTSGVDPITRREFWAHINGLVDKGVTVLVTTHFMDEAEYCDRISLIYRGKSIALGSPDELKARVAGPANPDPTIEDAFVALVERSEREAA